MLAGSTLDKDLFGRSTEQKYGSGNTLTYLEVLRVATAYEVAQHAGVSVGTVSRYLNQNGYVAAKTAGRIRAAIEELGYVPNGAARSLTTKRTGLIGFVVSDLRNPFTAELADAIQERANEGGSCVVLYGTNGDEERTVRGIAALRGHNIDGLIVTPPESPKINRAVTSAADAGIPVVLIGMTLDRPAGDRVSTDTYQGAGAALEHLAGLGHRRIGFVGARDQAQGRRRAYEDSLTRLGLVSDPRLCVLTELTRKGGLQAADALLDLPDPPTAIFAANDVMALGVYEAAYRRGTHIPSQLSVVGFDDIDLASHAAPPLTTVAQPKRQMGIEAMRLLESRLNDLTQFDPRDLRLNCRLVLRESTAPPPGEESQR
ncbi:LacI family DNA-binding transcriptional regulator [Kribbella sp. NPDC006257]|uniref:LacI family DNA-binding transcriptional regulator n=1 Tax=Kribbella sp. NPDC006257 TaxID=3156738 RepID=UPI0033A82543